MYMLYHLHLPIQAGLIKEDPKTTWKIKLYEDANGKKKGDALICYKLEPSVDLAIELLDNSHFRPGCVIQVQKAQFKMKGEIRIMAVWTGAVDRCCHE